MSAVTDDLRSWSPRQWGTMVGLVTLAQLTLIVLLLEKDAEVPARVAPPPDLRVIALQPEGGTSAALLEAVDPTVFALPGPRSFSGAAWRQPLRSPAAPAGWNEGLRWLSGQTQWFGQVTGSTGATATAGLSSGEGFVPAPRRVEAAPIPLAPGSTVTLDAGLAARGWLTPLVAPVMVHTNLLGRTEVQVSVEPDGWVFSAVVLRGCGLARADEAAVALARTARFTPLPGAGSPALERQWGRLRFDWRTVPPASDPAPPPSGE
jgi:TonB family protein